jgi:hypothetical protein
MMLTLIALCAITRVQFLLRSTDLRECSLCALRAIIKVGSNPATPVALLIYGGLAEKKMQP